MQDLKNIVESLLFVAEEPLGPERLRKILEPAEAGAIAEARKRRVASIWTWSPRPVHCMRSRQWSAKRPAALMITSSRCS